MKHSNDFALFILTHGRADNVITYKKLRSAGYSGKIYLLIDNEDDQHDLYVKKYGDQVIVFDKSKYAGKFDVGDNFKSYNAVVYARNACFDIAESLGLKYFMEYDDDYSSIEYKFNHRNEFGAHPIKNLDRIFDILIDYYQSGGFFDLAMAQGGDWIGGADNGFENRKGARRKCMNTHILSTERRFNFLGKINEDVISPLVYGSRGVLFFTVPQVSITQKRTQSNTGGLTDIYLELGTYVKSFYSVMFAPSCVKCMMMGLSHKRIHHQVKWKFAVPRIIRETHKKMET